MDIEKRPSPYKLWEMSKGKESQYKNLLLKHGWITIKKENKMHYRNGREAQNGDKIVKLGMSDGKIISFGVLHGATPGNDYCNGNIAPVQNPVDGACTLTM